MNFDRKLCFKPQELVQSESVLKNADVSVNHVSKKTVSVLLLFCFVTEQNIYYSSHDLYRHGLEFVYRVPCLFSGFLCMWWTLFETMSCLRKPFEGEQER